MQKHVTTPQEVITALGGYAEVAHLLKLPVNVVWNWQSRKLPSSTFHALHTLLNAKGISAPISLWDQYEIQGIDE